MLHLEPVRERPGKWVSHSPEGEPVLLFEKDSPVCRVRICDQRQQDYRGRLLAIFVGSDSFAAACRWAEERDVAEAGRFPPVRADLQHREESTSRKAG